MDNWQEQMYNYGYHEISYQRKFPPWDGFFSFSYHKITLFEKKYDIKVAGVDGGATNRK